MAGRVADGVIHCFDPRTAEVVAEVACTPTTEIPGLVQGARDAQLLWSDQGLKRRKWLVDDVRQDFLALGSELAERMAEECGRPAGEVWTTSIVATNDLFAYWLGHIDDLMTAFPIGLNPISYPRKRGVVRLEPKGVLGLITPWNLPIAIPMRAIIPALLAGNSVVWKPSEHTARLGAWLGEVWNKRLPEGVLTVVQGDGAQGSAIVRSGVDGVFFTGSEATGRKVRLAAAENGISPALELGGKDAALVLQDAHIPRAARGITWAAFGFAGQNCAAVERCYVHRSVYDAFLAAVVEETRKLRPMLDIGPLITPAQLDIVKAHVSAAVAEGAQAVVGGDAPGPGWYHSPTVLTGVTDKMAVMQEETFGPVLPVLPFDDIEEAIGRVNGTRFGLTTSVWTANLDYGEALAPRFDCGVVTVNNHAFTGALPDGTWGGRKASGDGVTNSRFSLYEMTRPRTVVVDALGQPENWWYPYNDALVALTQGLTELSRKGGDRLQGVRGAVTGLLNRWKG